MWCVIVTSRRTGEILRREFNCNIVRCSHYPQTEAFLDACDELGLMVWQETPGWGYLGDQAWKELVVRDVGEMIRRDRNHPAIIIWGVRVNESSTASARRALWISTVLTAARRGPPISTCWTTRARSGYRRWCSG